VIERLALKAILIFLAVLVFFAFQDTLTRMFWLTCCTLTAILTYWLKHLEAENTSLNRVKVLTRELERQECKFANSLTEIKNLNDKVNGLNFEIFHLQNPKVDRTLKEIRPNAILGVYEVMVEKELAKAKFKAFKKEVKK